MELVTVNLGNPAHNVTALQRRAQLSRLARMRPDVIATQEGRSTLGTPTGYRAYPASPPPGGHEDRILVRKTRKVLAHGWAMLVHEGQAHVWPARYVPYVVIDRGSKRPPLYVVDVHLESKIETRGRFTATGERRAVTTAHIDGVGAFVEFVHGIGCQAVVLGDTNVDAYADNRVRASAFPARQWARAGLVEALPARPSGTLGSRRVDRAFATRGLRVSVRDLARRAPYDHQPVAVTLT